MAQLRFILVEQGSQSSHILAINEMKKPLVMDLYQSPSVQRGLHDEWWGGAWSDPNKRMGEGNDASEGA